MISIKFIKPKKKSLASKNQGVDVQQRIAQLSDTELLKAADAYFARFTTDSIQYKKPFSDPAQSPKLAMHLGIMLQAADLFRGARVLDFGCSTGWLTLGLAQMGCDAIGIDVTPSAIRLAERLKATRRVKSDGSMDFHCYDGYRLPLSDESIDRIVCFEAFHHLRDQAAILKEFARVLKQGGRVAFLEPGPEHSQTIESQTEMSQYKVIENNVSLPRIAEIAAQVGLRPPEVLVQFQQPQQLSFAEFEQWSTKGISVKRAHALLKTLVNQVTDTQCFYLQKGEAQMDSRQLKTLGGELQLLSLVKESVGGSPGLRFALTLRNNGTGKWLTELVQAGQVRLGVQLLNSDEAVVNLNYARFDLNATPVEISQECVINGVLRLPAKDAYILRFDLVAEHVAWFAQHGRSSPLTFTSQELKEQRLL